MIESRTGQDRTGEGRREIERKKMIIDKKYVRETRLSRVHAREMRKIQVKITRLYQTDRLEIIEF